LGWLFVSCVISLSPPSLLGTAPALATLRSLRVPHDDPYSGGSPWCAMCLQVVGMVDEVIDSQPSQEAVEAALDLVCRLLYPSSSPSRTTVYPRITAVNLGQPRACVRQCEHFVHEYKNVVLFNFEEEVDAQWVCDGLEVCITNVTAPRFPHSAFTSDPSRVAVSWFTYGTYWIE
jgi:hypothetical protein